MSSVRCREMTLVMSLIGEVIELDDHENKYYYEKVKPFDRIDAARHPC